MLTVVDRRSRCGRQAAGARKTSKTGMADHLSDRHPNGGLLINVMAILGNRLGYYIQAPRYYRYDLQELRRLEPPQRPSTPSIEETWTT